MTVATPRQRLVPPEHVAELLGCTRQYVFDMVEKGRCPKHITLGHRTVRFDMEVIERWVDQGCPTVDEFDAGDTGDE